MVRSTTGPGRIRRRLTLLTVVLALLPAARGRPAPHPAPGRRRSAGLGRLQLAGAGLLPVPGPARPRAGAARAAPPATLASAGTRSERGSDRPGGTTAVQTGGLRGRRGARTRTRGGSSSPAGLAATAGVVALGTAGTGAYFANAAPVVAPGADHPARASTRPSTACGSSRSPTATCRPPTADAGSSGWSRSSTRSARTSWRSSATWSTAASRSCARTSPRSPTWSSEQGVYFVTGNHEYFVDTRAWLRHLPTLGVDVLRNERVAIGRGTAAFDLAGHRRPHRGVLRACPATAPNLDAALDGRDDATPVVLLAHQPVMVEQARRGRGRPAAVRAHPRRAAVALRLRRSGWTSRRWRGCRRHGDTQLYVTRGAGYWGPPMRVGARPEVTVVELRSPSLTPGQAVPPWCRAANASSTSSSQVALAVAVRPRQQAGRERRHVRVDDDGLGRAQCLAGLRSAARRPACRRSCARTRPRGCAATVSRR